MLVGFPPFYHQNLDKLESDIKQREPNMTKITNPDIKYLIKSLLNKNSEDRLSNFFELKNCAWLKHVDWKMI